MSLFLLKLLMSTRLFIQICILFMLLFIMWQVHQMTSNLIRLSQPVLIEKNLININKASGVYNYGEKGWEILSQEKEIICPDLKLIKPKK